jgi:hypothetical protein
MFSFSSAAAALGGELLLWKISSRRSDGDGDPRGSGARRRRRCCCCRCTRHQQALRSPVGVVLFGDLSIPKMTEVGELARLHQRRKPTQARPLVVCLRRKMHGVPPLDNARRPTSATPMPHHTTSRIKTDTHTHTRQSGRLSSSIRQATTLKTSWRRGSDDDDDVGGGWSAAAGPAAAAHT